LVVPGVGYLVNMMRREVMGERIQKTGDRIQNYLHFTPPRTVKQAGIITTKVTVVLFLARSPRTREVLSRRRAVPKYVRDSAEQFLTLTGRQHRLLFPG
jgi:hypothetical protein